MEIKKLTSDVCISCGKTKEDSYKSYCSGCYEPGRLRECLGCRQTIGSHTTACSQCRREQPLKLAIADLLERVAILESQREVEQIFQ